MTPSRLTSTRPLAEQATARPASQGGLDTRSDAGGSGAGLLGLPGSRGGRDGLPQPPTDRDPPAILEPERGRRRSNRNPATAPGSPTRLACAPLRRGGSWPRGLAGCRPIPHQLTACRAAAALGASRCPRQPARPGGGACGPFRAALRTYRSCEKGLLARPKQSVGSDDCFDASTRSIDALLFD